MTLSAEMSAIGTAIGQRENLSTAVSRYVKPLDSVSLTKSMLMWRKRLLGTVNSPMGGVVCRVTFDC